MPAYHTINSAGKLPGFPTKHRAVPETKNSDRSTSALVTGAGGYIGSWIANSLSKKGHCVIAGSREPLMPDQSSAGFENRVYGDLRNPVNWRSHLTNVNSLIHTAGFVHRKEPLSQAAIDDARKLNDQLVADMASAAVDVGVEHIILISTIAVHGPSVDNDVIDEEASLVPASTYAETKLRGEQNLIDCCQGTDTAWTIIRPAMVYGPDCPGNFPDLVRLVRTRIPLPFGNAHNKRSFLYIENLVDLVALCVERTEARNEIFVAADPAPVSTNALVRWIAEGSGMRALQWPFPWRLVEPLRRAGRVGRRLSSLIDDLEVDSRKAREVLGWQPPCDTRNGVLRTLEAS